MAMDMVQTLMNEEHLSEAEARIVVNGGGIIRVQGKKPEIFDPRVVTEQTRNRGKEKTLAEQYPEAEEFEKSMKEWAARSRRSTKRVGPSQPRY